MSSLVSDLNSQQREALATLDGPMLILAGAGSGKTRVLTYRIADLILEGRAGAYEIWATTFTNKAAEEMRHRVRNLLDAQGLAGGALPWVSTFHSAAADTLRRYGKLIGLDPHFSIYDDTDQISLLKKVMVELQLSEKQWNPKTLRYHIDQLKNRGVDPLAFSRTASTYEKEVIYRVYEHYQKQLRSAQAVDFGDLLMEAVRLLKEKPEVKAEMHRRYKYFLVDEFQDTNPIQYEWVRLLSEHTRNLCVVGDEDQSIYGWRGADIANILNFKKDYADAKVIKLERNYRSTRTIVDAASKVIANNTERMDKHLYSEAEEGEPIAVFGVTSEHEEADRIVQEIQARRSQGIELAEMAVFYRTNAQSRVIEERLRALRLPYQVYGGLKFYDRAEIKDALAYLRLCVNPMDDVAFMRVVNVPARGIGKTSVQKLLEQKSQRGGSLLSIAEQEGVLSGKARVGMIEFLEFMNELKHMVNTGQTPLAIFQHWWTGSRYVDMLKQENSVESMSRLENLAELQNSIRDYMGRVTAPALSGFLEEIALYTDRLEEQGITEKGVSLMTLHSSKGLEFDVVFLTGMEEGLFPSQRAIEENKVEEERRLFYVGMTRARRVLHLMFAHNRMSYGVTQPRLTSRFLEEVPHTHVKMMGHGSRRPSVRFEEEFFDKRHLDEEDVTQDHREQARSSVIDEDMPAIQLNDDRVVRRLPDVTAGMRYRKGMRVRHHEYGVGLIQKCEGTPGDERILVSFQDFGPRKFMAKFAQLEVLNGR